MGQHSRVWWISPKVSSLYFIKRFSMLNSISNAITSSLFRYTVTSFCLIWCILLSRVLPLLHTGYTYDSNNNILNWEVTYIFGNIICKLDALTFLTLKLKAMKFNILYNNFITYITLHTFHYIVIIILSKLSYWWLVPNDLNKTVKATYFKQ